jgi:hypothetical protein
MHKAIQVVKDSKRGCGWRTKRGSLYFRSDNPGVPCGVLPLELKPCETCAAMGLKCRTAPSRGFTWVNPSKLFDWKMIRCPNLPPDIPPGLCDMCMMNIIATSERSGLLWVGEKFYATPGDFDKESNSLGISRRLPHDHLPKGFKIGQDFILLAHKKAVLRVCNYETEMGMFDYFPGVFRVFRPDRIEVVVTGDEPDEEIEGYLERGLTPVKIVRD